MSTIDSYEVCFESLKTLQEASLENALDLLTESKTLFEINHYARACFLAIAATEEIGKAYLAFNGRGRNLTNQAVTRKIKVLIGSHKNKISSAFLGLLANSAIDNKSDTNADIDLSLKLMLELQQKREESLYTDIDRASKIRRPSVSVDQYTSDRSINIAFMCYQGTLQYLQGKEPPKSSSASDKLFCFKPNVLSEMMSEDYCRFLIQELKNGATHDEAIVTYHDKFWAKGKTFLTR